MTSIDTNKATAAGKELTTAEGLLVSALDMEDEIAHSVYVDYLDRGNWPDGLKDKNVEGVNVRDVAEIVADSLK